MTYGAEIARLIDEAHARAMRERGSDKFLSFDEFVGGGFKCVRNFRCVIWVDY